MNEDKLPALERRMRSFSIDIGQIFGKIESSPQRAITLDQSYEKLTSLSLRQDEIFRQALRCVEVEVFRAAHVMAWSGCVDCFHDLCASDGFNSLNLAMPNWNVKNIDDLRDNQTEYALIDALHKMRVLTKPEKKALHGMLSRRNECAHANDYFPGLNETLGYISEIFSRLISLEKRFPKFLLN